MKKQISLIALTTLLVSFVAFSGVASAQTSTVQVLFFHSPLCEACDIVQPRAAAAAENGVQLFSYDVSEATGLGMAKANGVTGTPTIVIQGGATLTGVVTQQQISAAIKAAKSAATPTIAKASATPKAKTPVVEAAATPKATTPDVKAAATVKDASTYTGAVVASKATTTKYFHIPDKCIGARSINAANAVWFPSPTAAIAAGYKPCPTCFPNGVAQQLQSKTNTAQPTIEVVQPQTATKTTAQTVPEFSLLGLGAPALVVGAIYLFLRRR